MITGGICFSYWLDFGFSFLDPETIAWRFPVGFQIVMELVIVLFVLELPESPRWLVLRGQEDEAMSVLSALNDRPIDDVSVKGNDTWTGLTEMYQAFHLLGIHGHQGHSLRDVPGWLP